MKLITLCFLTLISASTVQAVEHELLPIDEGNSIDNNHDGIFDYDYIYPLHLIRDTQAESPAIVARAAKEYEFPTAVAGNGEIISATLRFGFSTKEVFSGTPKYYMYSYVANGSYERNGDLIPIGEPIFEVLVNDIVTGQNLLDITELVAAAHINNEKIGLMFMVDTGAEVQQYDAAYWSTIVIDHLPSDGGDGNNSPLVNILSPLSNQTPRFGTPLNFTASSSDPEDGDLTDLIHWYSDTDGILGVGGLLTGMILPQGINTITAQVTDSGGKTSLDTVQITVLEAYNEPPVVIILAPDSGSTESSEQGILFEATAEDTIDGSLSSQIEWWSDIDGFLGIGQTLSRSLSVGHHTVTAKAKDSFDEYGSETVVVTVTGSAPVTDYCEARGRNTSYEYLDQVSLAGVAYQSGNNGGYHAGDEVFTLARGGNRVELVAGFPSGQYNEHFSVYIDLDNNGQYESDENVFNAQGKTVSGEILIPDHLASGHYAMRVLMNYGSPLGPCQSFTYGEVEDYAVTVED